MGSVATLATLNAERSHALLLTYKQCLVLGVSLLSLFVYCKSMIILPSSDMEIANLLFVDHACL